MDFLIALATSVALIAVFYGTYRIALHVARTYPPIRLTVDYKGRRVFSVTSTPRGR